VNENPSLKAIAVLVLIAVNLAVFLPSMKGDFLWDDRYFISENPALLGPGFLGRFLWSPFGGFSGVDENSISLDRTAQFYRPLTSLSYWVDFKIWGLNPAGFHLTNILIQIANSLLLFFVLAAIGMGPIASLASALLFSVFPTHFENVSWISGRTDLLSFFFAALSVLFFVKYFTKKNASLLILSSLCYLGALLSKENCLFLPAIFFLALLLKKTEIKKAFRLILPFAAAFLLWAVLRRIAVGSPAPGFSGRTVSEFFGAIGFYALKTLVPFDLSVTVEAYYVFKQVAFQVIGAMIAALFMIAGIFLFKKHSQQRVSAFFFIGFCLLLLPSAAVIFSSWTISLIAWRFFYLSSAVFVSSLAYFVWTKWKVKAVAAGLLTVLFIFYTAEIYPKNRLFGNTETDFWLGIKKIDREDIIARSNIGIKYLDRDEKRALEILNSILGQKDHPLYKIWEIRIYEELAEFYTLKRDFASAEKYFNLLFKLQPVQSQHGYFNYADFLALTGKVREGEQIIHQMLTMFPANHLVLNYTVRFYLLIKDYDKAVEFIKKDCALFPDKKNVRLLREIEALQKK